MTQADAQTAALREVIAQLYSHLPDRLPATLTACSCAHCLPEPDRARMIATPVRELPAELIRTYTQSAQAPGTDPQELRALLPRYLDLLTEDVAVEDANLGIGLRCFGDARARSPALFDKPTLALLDIWARLMILRLGGAAAPKLPSQAGPEPVLALTELLLVGGWPVRQVTSAMDALFATVNGPALRLRVLQALGSALDRHGHPGFATLARVRPEAAPELAGWMNRLLTDPAVTAILLTHDPQDAPWAGALWLRAGQITAGQINAPATQDNSAVRSGRPTA